MKKLLAIVAASVLIPGSAFAQTLTYSPGQTGAVGTYITVTDPSGNVRRILLPNVSDANNAPYSKATAITVGTPITASRGVAADCTAGGTVTLTMAGGGSLSWTVAPGHQNQPYSVTGVSAAGGAACTFYGLN